MAFRAAYQAGQQRECSQSVAGRFDAIGQQRIVGVFTIAASETAPCRRAFRIAVQPFDDATGKGLCLGLRTRQSAIELNDAGTLVKEDLPVLRRPAVFGRPKQHHDLGLVPGQRIEHRRRRRRRRLQHQVVTVDPEMHTGSPRCL